MSFATELYTLMHADASLNKLCTGGIHYEHLPENFELSNTWVVYTFNKASQSNCLGTPNVFTEYTLIVKIVANDTLLLEYINDYITDYLNNYSGDKFEDIIFVGDDHALDLDKNLYLNTLTFNVTYIRNSYV